MNENVERIRKSVNWGGRVKRLNLLVVMALMLSLIMPLAAPFAQQAARIQPLLVQLAAQDPDQVVSVIVQKSVKDDRVEQAVGALGGTVTKDLHIINAFAAEMKAKRRDTTGQGRRCALGLIRCAHAIGGDQVHDLGHGTGHDRPQRLYECREHPVASGHERYLWLWQER